MRPCGGSPRGTPSSSEETGESRVAQRPPLLLRWASLHGGPFPCRYWRFNEDGSSVGHGYPRKVSVWAGVPDAPRGAFLSPDAGK